MKYVGVCRIKQGKRTEYELSQAEIEDIKQYIPQALREGAASGVCEGSGGRVCRGGAPDHCGKSGKYADALHSGIPGNAGDLPGRSGP